MNLLKLTCADARRHLLRMDELDAVGKGLVEIHLRRCEACARIADEFNRIETGAAPRGEVTEEQKRNIYNRLVPAVHELTSQPPPPPGHAHNADLAMNVRYWWGAALLAVAAAVLCLALMKYL